MVALKIIIFGELFKRRIPKETKELYKKERAEWIQTREMPITVKENVLKATVGFEDKKVRRFLPFFYLYC